MILVTWSFGRYPRGDFNELQNEIWHVNECHLDENEQVREGNFQVKGITLKQAEINNNSVLAYTDDET